MTPRHPARVDEDCRLVLKVPERVSRLRGRDVWVSIHEKPTVGLRSNSANSYLWAVVYETIADATGCDPKAIHYGLKREAIRIGILDPEYILLGDKPVEAEPTTRTDSDTFARYTSWIRHEAEHGDLTGTPLHIPEPGE